MDPITQEAISGLTSAVTALLPPGGDPGMSPRLRVIPRRVTPTGLGGFVGHHATPTGEIHGRRLAARLFVSARAAEFDGAETAAEAVAGALLGASQAELRGSGILRLSLADRGAAGVRGEGESQISERELEFDVLYEYLRLPSEAEGVIESVPLHLEMGSTAEGGQLLFRSDFSEDPLDRFEVVDDVGAGEGGPSEWSHDAAEALVQQTSSIRGGVDGVGAEKPGTYLILRSAGDLPAVRDFMLGAELRSEGQDEIGLVFRYLSPDDFYLLQLSARASYRMLSKKVGGVFAPLDDPALDLTGGYEPGAVHTVRLTAQGEEFRVLVDGLRVLEGRDSSLTEPGRVGFYCRANSQASFHHIELIAL